MRETTRTFRRAYCDLFGCSDEAFDRHLFWRSLYRRSLPWAALIWMVHREFFRRDLRTIQQLGICTSPDEFRSELKAFDYENKSNRGFVRCTCRVRISVKRLLAIEKIISASRGTDRLPKFQKPSDRTNSPAAT